MVQQVRPYHEATLLDGTAQSVRHGELLRDSSGQSDNVNSQEVASSQNFIIGSDAAEFVNRVNDQVRKRQNVQRCRRRRRTFCNLVNVHGCDDACSDIHGKEFPRQSEFHVEYHRSHTEENVRRIREIGDRTRWDLQSGYDYLGKTIMEISVIHWRNHHQSPTHESLRLFEFCVVFWKGSSTSEVQRSLEGQDRMDHKWQKLQRLWWKVESRLNSSGTSSQDSQRCSSGVKSMVYWADWEKHQKLSQEEFFSCQCSMTFLVTMGQSIVLGEIKAEVLLQNENPFESSNSMATVHRTNWIAFTRKQSE